MPKASCQVPSATSRASLLTESSAGGAVLDVHAGRRSPAYPGLLYLLHLRACLAQAMALLQGGSRTTYRL